MPGEQRALLPKRPPSPYHRAAISPAEPPIHSTEPPWRGNPGPSGQAGAGLGTRTKKGRIGVEVGRPESHVGGQAGTPRHTLSLTLSKVWALVTSSVKSGGLDLNGIFLKCFPRLFPNGRGRKLFYLKHCGWRHRKHWGWRPKQLSPGRWLKQGL